MEDKIIKISNIINEADDAYVRVIRELNLVGNSQVNNRKARKYINDIKEESFQSISQLIDTEKENLIETAKVKIDEDRDQMKRNNELILMKSLIEGADPKRLIELAEKYHNTEYQGDFEILVESKVNYLIENSGAHRFKNQELIDEMYYILNAPPKEVAPEIELLDNLLEDIKSMYYFNNSNFNLVANISNNRILHGQWQSRNIESDLSNVTDNFNPLNKQLEPLVTTENHGIKNFKTVNLLFDWEED